MAMITYTYIPKFDQESNLQTYCKLSLILLNQIYGQISFILLYKYTIIDNEIIYYIVYLPDIN